jgi:hypothetical protein
MDMTTADAPAPGNLEYRFELVEAQPAGPGKSRIALRLVFVPQNKTVEDAAIGTHPVKAALRRGDKVIGMLARNWS